MKTEKIDDRLFRIYNNLLYCKNKQTVDIDITNYIIDFKKFITETEIYKFKDYTYTIINLIVYAMLYQNVKEILYDVLDMFSKDLEPEEENLLVGYVEDVKNDILLLNPLLKSAKLTVPFDIVRLYDKVVIRLLICFEKWIRSCYVV